MKQEVELVAGRGVPRFGGAGSWGVLAVIAVVGWAVSAPAHAGTTLTTLASFDGQDGLWPYCGLIADASGNLYGTTYEGGAYGYGTVFKVASGTHALTALVSFSGSANGGMPNVGLIADASGNLYGTTSQGGANGQGTVFRVAAGSYALTTLAWFAAHPAASFRGGLVADASGNLYGTTIVGGPNDVGIVYELLAGTNTLATLATFSGNNGSGPMPWGSLIIDTSGNVYGTTGSGGAYGYGTVFKVAAGTRALTTLASFNGSDGSYPWAGLIADTSGNLYGTTTRGGTYGYGTVFKVAAGTHTLTALASFNGSNGSDPTCSLIADAAGNLYGTTELGGANDYGTVFKVDAVTHAVTTLVSFDGTNGKWPVANLIADANGNLYGTTVGGGIKGLGTLFELSDTGFVVPEPATLSLLALGGLAMIRRRRMP